MIISAYTPQVVTSRAKPFEYNFELITNVLAARQASYNKAFEGIKNLRKQALSIRFLNESAQAEIDQKNNQINDYFNSLNNEFGDLAEPQVAQRYTELFKSIASDRDLINQYQKDLKIQTDISTVDNMRKASDPAKAGFHPMNYENFLVGVQKYTKSNFRTEKVEPDPYVPYLDMNKELAVLMRGIPITKTKKDVLSPEGYITTITQEGRDPAAVQQVTQEYIQSKGLPQLREQAKYYYRHTIQDDDDKLYLMGQYNNMITSQIQTLEKAKETATPEQLPMFEQKISELRMKTYTPEEYLGLEENDYVDHLTTVQTYESISNYTQSYGKQAISQEIRPDTYQMHLQELKQKAAEQGVVDPSQPLGAGISQEFSDGTLEVDLRGVESTFTAIGKSIDGQLSNEYASPAYNNAFLGYVNSGIEPTEFIPAGKNEPMNLTNTFYFRAFKMAYDNLMRQPNRPTGQAAVDAAKKEADRILQEPSNRDEANLHEEMVVLRQRREAIGRLMQAAANSGNIRQYLENEGLMKFFNYTRADVNPATYTSAAKKAQASEYRVFLANAISTKISTGVVLEDLEDEDMTAIRNIPPQYIQAVERHIDGTVRIYFTEEAMNGTDGKEAPLANKYIAYNENGMPTGAAITQGMRIRIPELDQLSLERTMPMYLSNVPMRLFAYNRSNERIPYQIQRQSDGSIMYKIGNGEWTKAAYDVPEQVMTNIKQFINASERPNPARPQQ